MPQAKFSFPPGFLWGTATASHQVEGGNTNNNWSVWEKADGKIINGHTAGLACDWWGGRWKQDFDRAAETGQNAHRLSLEWSRIQPTPEHWDETALDYYREIIRGLHSRKMTPLVTLHHFSDPLWLMDRGGWEDEETPQMFVRYVRKVVEALKEYVTIWVTINEPNLYTYFGYIDGLFPPGKKDLKSAFRVGRNLLRGHAAAYRAIHEIQKEARVGMAHHFRAFKPAHPLNPLDSWMTAFITSNLNDTFPRTLAKGRFSFLGKQVSMREAINTQDYFGLNYYTLELLRFAPLAFKDSFQKRTFPPEAELSTTGFIANVPEGMRMAIRWAHNFRKPILILENGFEDSDDTHRPRYLLEHIHQTWRLMNINVPIKGYFCWTLVDNFEWERGWSQRFGLWGLDPQTQVRTRRASADLFAEICRENGITSAIVEKYAPQIFSQMFPG